MSASQNTDLVLSLVLAHLTAAAKASALLQKVRAEGREVSRDELAGLQLEDDAARRDRLRALEELGGVVTGRPDA